MALIAARRRRSRPVAYRHRREEKRRAITGVDAKEAIVPKRPR